MGRNQRKIWRSNILFRVRVEDKVESNRWDLYQFHIPLQPVYDSIVLTDALAKMLDNSADVMFYNK
jgi:hypothetical protein